MIAQRRPPVSHCALSPYEKDCVSEAANTPILTLLALDVNGKENSHRMHAGLENKVDIAERRSPRQQSLPSPVEVLEKGERRRNAASAQTDKLRSNEQVNSHTTKEAAMKDSTENTRSKSMDAVSTFSVPDDDGVLFRKKLSETEQRFKEQMTVHRGLSRALRDVSKVHGEVVLLKSEEKLSNMLSLLRLRQDEHFARVSSDGAVTAPVRPSLATVASPSVAAAPSTYSQASCAVRTTPTMGCGKTGAFFAAQGASPTSSAPRATLTAPAVASPLRDVLETFSKPRALRTAAIPAPPPLTVAAATGLSGAPAAKHGRQPVISRCGVVNMQEEVPQPYVQIRWVPRRIASPQADISPFLSTGEDFDAFLPVDETRAAFTALNSVEGSGTSVIYDDDFTEATDSKSRVTEEDEEGRGSASRARAELAQQTSKNASSFLQDTSNSIVTASGEESGSDVLTSASSRDVKTEEGTITSGVTSLTEAGMRRSLTAGPRRDQKHAKERKRTLSTVEDRPSAQILNEFLEACQKANRLGRRLVDDDFTEEREDRAKGRVATAANSVSGDASARPLLAAEFADVRRLRAFNRRLQKNLATLDLERRAHRAKGELLKKAQLLARAHRALTGDERAILDEVLPPGVDVKALLATREEPRNQSAGRQTNNATDRKAKYSKVRGGKKKDKQSSGDSFDVISTEEDVVSEVSDAYVGGWKSGESVEDNGIVETDLESDIPSDSAFDSGIIEELDELTENGDSQLSTLSSIPVEGSTLLSSANSSSEQQRHTSSPERRSSASIMDDSDVKFDELEEAVQRAIDEHNVEHVFRRNAKYQAARGDASMKNGTASIEEEVPSHLLRRAEESLADRLANESISSTSRLLSDADIEEAIQKLPSFGSAAVGIPAYDSSEIQTVSEIHTVASQTNGAPTASPRPVGEKTSVSVPAADGVGMSMLTASVTTMPIPADSGAVTPYAGSSSADAAGTGTSSAVAWSTGADAPATSSLASSEKQTARRPPASLSDSTTTAANGKLQELGERELQDLEADMNATAHRRRRALRTLRAVVVPHPERTDGDAPEGPEAGWESSQVIPTFTQLYDPNDSALTSLDASVTSGESGTKKRAAFSNERRYDDGRGRNEVLLRLRALDDAATSARFQGKRVFFAESDLLRPWVNPQPASLPKKGRKSVSTQASTSPTPAASTVAASKEPATEEASNVGAEAELVKPPYQGENLSLNQEAAQHRELRETATMKGTLPNFAEDFVAQNAWKQQQLSLFQELRHVVPVDDADDMALNREDAADDTSVDDSSGRDINARTGGEEAQGSFTYHWGMLSSLLESRFGRCSDSHHMDPICYPQASSYVQHDYGASTFDCDPEVPSLYYGEEMDDQPVADASSDSSYSGWEGGDSGSAASSAASAASTSAETHVSES